MLTQAPKGTKDMTPGEAHLWQMIERMERAYAEEAGYREVRTPAFEHTELFMRGVGDTTDIVQKEMYTFLDKGERSITLRPEGTAGVARAFLENKLYADALPCKMYYVSIPVFRYENPQAGRFREHHQFGMECFGGKEPTVEAELIGTLMRLLTALGLKNLSVSVNSIGCPECRPRYHTLLKEYLGAHLADLCPTCRERFERNPLRVLDCKVESCKALVKDAPSMLDTLCGECAEHFEGLRTLLTAQGIPFRVDSRIVRGLDYYTKTVFEIIMQSGREGLALCGGGRYDGLVEELGGPKTPAAGFGIGIERIIMELRNANAVPPAPRTCDVFVSALDADARPQAFLLAQRLRALGVKADCDHAGRSLKAQFKFADKLSCPYVAIIGGEELARGNVKVRNMHTREENEIALVAADTAIRNMMEDIYNG